MTHTEGPPKMTEDSLPRPMEPTALQLTRIEGVLNLIHYKVDDLVTTVARHEDEISKLKLETQQLALGAQARDREVVATAKALREAKEAQDSAIRTEMTKSEQSWTPFARMMTVLGCILGILTAVYMATH